MNYNFEGTSLTNIAIFFSPTPSSDKLQQMLQRFTKDYGSPKKLSGLKDRVLYRWLSDNSEMTLFMPKDATDAASIVISKPHPEVPSTTLHQRKIDASGMEVFTEEDLVLDESELPYKRIILTGVNKIHREISQCKDIDISTAGIAPNQGTKTDPVFFVTCGKALNAFNVYFSKSDVEKGKEFHAPAHVNKEMAINLCESYTKSQATHPSTVDFSRTIDLATTEYANGRTRIDSTFTAKNSFNLKLKYRISCLLHDKGLIESAISEAQ